jgi:6-phosphogluconolactonase
MINPAIRIFQDRQALQQEAAAFTRRSALEAVEARGRFLWVLSGGGTPGPVYEMLADRPYVEHMPWQSIQLFWGDERCVPADHPESNFGQARKLLLDRAPIPPENIHRIRGELAKEKAAGDYASRLAKIADPGLAWPRFDLVFLGMGDDGHTASLFPGGDQELESMTPVIGVKANYGGRPADRVTLTPMVFNSARRILFLVSGEGKAAVLARALRESGEPEELPVRRIRPPDGHVMWFVDKAAAKHLDNRNFRNA